MIVKCLFVLRPSALSDFECVCFVVCLMYAQSHVCEVNMINVQWNLKIMGTLAKEFLRDQTHLTGTKSPFKLSCYTFHRIVNMRSVRSLALKEEHSERAEHLWMFFLTWRKFIFLSLFSLSCLFSRFL